ncbi:MAG: GNAT family N-acetyltransferase [Betaproteobacteria bacterium]
MPRERYHPAAPVLETERLVLRPWREADVRAYSRILRDPEVMRHWGSGPRFRLRRALANQVARFVAVEARWAIASMNRHWHRYGFGQWAVEHKEMGSLLGNVGLTVLEDWTAGPTNVEIGWFLARPVWGRGYATEAARACIDYAFDIVQLPRLVSVTLVSNLRSERVMQSLALSRVGRTRWKGSEVVWYAVAQADWTRTGAAGSDTPRPRAQPT